MSAPEDARTALHRLYGTKQSEGVPPFLRQLYPQFLCFWQYLGTGTHHCPLEGPGYFYVPAEDPEAPLNFELKIRWPRHQCETPHTRAALYRLRDHTGLLLYVGISKDPLRRWPEHAKEKPWWPDVANFSLEWFDTWSLAIAAEAAAIRTERPLHNIVHNSKVLD